ncbi:MAG: NADH-quinone oxidoreductase subunit N [Chthonomonas sp.]|nr:NADH-quinone oxidoreductase subunit N [Chthonomonas sp.]
MFDVALPTIDWLVLSPVIAVLVAGVLGLMIETLRPKQNNNVIVGVSLVGLGVAAVLLGQQLQLFPTETFARMVVRDQLATLLQLALVGVGFIALLFSEGYLREKRIAFGEFYPLVLWSTAGAMIMVSTNSLLMIFIGLEILSISLYVLAGLSRGEEKSEESALKYFLLGAFASGFLLYGTAFVYGATGGVHLSGIAQAWALNEPMTRNLLSFGMGLLLVGLCFKSAFVPFHQWTPDVYQGAPTNVTAFMAAGSKIAAIGVLYRLLDACLLMKDLWLPALFWIAVLTMTVGNVLAVVQKDVKRLLGYSSIANAGYILAAIVAHAHMPATIGFSTVAFFLFNYALMTLGAFAIISLAAKDGKEGTRLADMNGLWKRAPFIAVVLIILVASLIGIPPTGGFFAKLFIFQDLMTAGLTGLAITLAVNSAISAYYYLGIIYHALVADEGTIKTPGAKPNLGLTAACALCAFGVLAMAIFNSPIMNILEQQGH